MLPRDCAGNPVFGERWNQFIKVHVLVGICSNWGPGKTDVTSIQSVATASSAPERFAASKSVLMEAVSLFSCEELE